MGASLVLISDREPLAWLLREQRFAVPAPRLGSAPTVGTELMLYTTRGCYRNPTRDRGRVMGLATVTSEPRLLDEPVTFRGRTFAAGFDVAIDGVAEPFTGVELAPLVGRLDAFPDAAIWSVRLRRSVIPLSDQDTALIRTALDPLLRPLTKCLDDYVAACKVAAAL